MIYCFRNVDTYIWSYKPRTAFLGYRFVKPWYIWTCLFLSIAISRMFIFIQYTGTACHCLSNSVLITCPCLDCLSPSTLEMNEILCKLLRGPRYSVKQHGLKMLIIYCINILDIGLDRQYIIIEAIYNFFYQLFVWEVSAHQAKCTAFVT